MNSMTFSSLFLPYFPIAKVWSTFSYQAEDVSPNCNRNNLQLLVLLIVRRCATIEINWVMPAWSSHEGLQQLLLAPEHPPRSSGWSQGTTHTNFMVY